MHRTCGNPACQNTVTRNGKVYPRYCSDDCKPRCTVGECESPQRKRTWCGSHYAQWQRTGQVRAFKYKWVLASQCLTCLGPMPEGLKSGRFCKPSCRMHWRNYDGSPPTEVACTQCGAGIPLTPHESGRRRRSDVMTCADCQWRYDPRKVMSVTELADRDGPECAICDEAVDLTLRFPDLMCGTVDHAWPRSRGGGNEPDNLQLAHLICNLRKGNKTPEEMVAL